MADLGAFRGVSQQRVASLLQPQPNAYIQSLQAAPAAVAVSRCSSLLLFLAGMVTGLAVCWLLLWFKHRQ